ncbi:TIGR01212 family radical SAM protein [Desulfonema ishimotonii]|uniref:TIGR01212 family radical SAM protein n=1 Tax=Desulfonema ishimotonii TaxID=45657 RepID=A0A401FRK1_9BACT|nr:TIGR01212 family radical SAM protein [Desulfonema ishimotonii]GBC59588.1 TIGR01212 family radical SAM protein [Desulfonema ishimotonii]
MTKKRYNDLNSYLRGLYGERVQKITVDAGLSCPNRDGTVSTGGCIYCNARGSGTGDYARGLGIAEQIRVNGEFIARRYKAKKFLIYFQSFSNTYAPVERLRQMYDEALSAIDGVVGLSVGTRPDCVSEEILCLLQGYAEKYLIWVEYGLQSAHDATLRQINRGHDFACFKRAVRATQGRGIRICTHVILGLPGEGRAEMMETAKQVAALGIDGIKLHLMYVVRGTRLDTMYQQGRYRCLEQAEYADLVCEFLEYLPPEMVIQRLTGDPHREELVAPSWSTDKRGTMNRIMETLEERDMWQGKRFRGPGAAG